MSSPDSWFPSSILSWMVFYIWLYSSFWLCPQLSVGGYVWTGKSERITLLPKDNWSFRDFQFIVTVVLDSYRAQDVSWNFQLCYKFIFILRHDASKMTSQLFLSQADWNFKVFQNRVPEQLNEGNLHSHAAILIIAVDEIHKHLKDLKANKSSNDIEPELLKKSNESPIMLQVVHSIMTNLWENLDLPNSWE